MQHKQTATLTISGRGDIELPLYTGTHGDQFLGIDTLAKQGVLTYDPGFLATASCASQITYIDGAQGVLHYRGYPIEFLAEHHDYMQVCYLLMHGDLPNDAAYRHFTQQINNHTLVHEQMCHFYNGFRRDAHPMAIMVAVVAAMSAFYHDSLNIKDPEMRQLSALRLIAKMPTLAAMSYKYTLGQPFVYPRNDMTYAQNFLHMMFSVPAQEVMPNPIFVQAIDKILTLHADHEQNASTSTVRMAGSTGANPFACIAAGIAALWGPAHGGANEACLNMLHEIGDKKHIDRYIKKARDPQDPFRLMGFGHRVYKNYDPRAKVMRGICHQVLAAADRQNDPLFEVAIELERIALEDDYFVERKLYPNVDFYSGITLSALGIPTNMFTVVFALARTVGWVSHWMEMIASPTHRISRPRQLYTGLDCRL